jgi:hypothetical protein
MAIWTEIAPKLTTHLVMPLATDGTYIYGGTTSSAPDYLPNLLRWNGANAWELKATGAYQNGYWVLSLIYYNGKIYGGTGAGKLWEWNGVDAWVEKAPLLNNQYVWDLASFVGSLYSVDGDWLRVWNGTDAWTQVTNTLAGFTPKRMVVLGAGLYAVDTSNGVLRLWDGGVGWTLKADVALAMQSFAVMNGKIYGGGYGNGKLYEWNGVDAWVEVAPAYLRLGAVQTILSLCVLGGELYAGTTDHGQLLKWNGTNAWVLVCDQLGAEENIFSLVTMGGALYGASNTTGKLYSVAILSAPTVTTQAVTAITTTTATGNGNITDTGGEACTLQGVCWDTVTGPTILDSHSANIGSFGTGAFTVPLVGLLPATKYYVRAYAYNSAGYSYGAEVEFTTLGTAYPSDSITRVTGLVHRYSPGNYTSEVYLGGTGTDFNDASLGDITATPQSVWKQSVKEMNALIDEAGAQGYVTEKGISQEYFTNKYGPAWAQTADTPGRTMAMKAFFSAVHPDEPIPEAM